MMMISAQTDKSFPGISRLFIVLLLMVPVLACSVSGQGAVKLVEDANSKLQGTTIAGGLEFPSVRADMKAQYDEALRIADATTLSEPDDRFVKAHAHFGLAMVRIFDLASRVEVIFEEGGVLAALRGDDSSDPENGRPPYCTLFEDFTALESIMVLLLETSLTPIVEDLSAALAAAGAEFEQPIDRGRYDLSNFSAEAGASYFEFAAVYGASDVQLLLGVAELVSGLFRFMFAYEDVFANLFLFSFVADQPSHNQPAKLFNSNPCAESAEAGNPLLDSEFGVLVPGAGTEIALARTFLTSAFLNLANAFANPAETDAAAHLIGGGGLGQPWATGLAETPSGENRYVLTLPTRDTPMHRVKNILDLVRIFFTTATGFIDIAEFANLLGDIGQAMEDSDTWDVQESLRRIAPDGALGTLIDNWQGRTGAGDSVADLDVLEAPFVNFGRLLVAPPGDFRSFLPRYFLASEIFTDANNNGRRDTKSDLIIAQGEQDYANTESFVDQNCNGRWDQRGDFVTQNEFEPFQDSNLSRSLDPGELSPLGGGVAPGELGIIGAFLDTDTDAVPDRKLVDGLRVSVGSDPICGSAAPITWPGAEPDPAFGAYRLSLGPSTVTAPYGTVLTAASSSDSPYHDGRVLGVVAGHYWPPQDFNFTGWPVGARKDAANGTFDEDYLFFDDPTLGGWLIRNLDGEPAPASSDNAWINRLLSHWNSIQTALGL